MTREEADIIRNTVRSFYGEGAVIRNYGPDPTHLRLHVEIDSEPGLEVHDCLGLLMRDIDRDRISLAATKRGRRIHGDARIAYRQGEVLFQFPQATYDTLGEGYAHRRRPDPRIAAAIWSALGDARSVINVGAGAGSYEPSDRSVLAVEPSDVNPGTLYLFRETSGTITAPQP